MLAVAASAWLLSLVVQAGGDAVRAQAPTAAPAGTDSIWTGAYTDAQASRGEERYRAACAACHAEDLLGASGPPLVGQAYLDRWNGSTVFDAVQQMKQTMPQEAPDSLGMAAYVDIMSFLLKNNGSPAGTSELPAEPEALRQIQMSSRTP